MGEVLDGLTAALSGRYAIEREVGAGGMATVYLARDLRHDRRVALKVLRPELAAIVGADRFLAEIKTTANLQHPHILPLFDSGQADSFLYYVMPYVEGETLRDRLDRELELPVDEAVRIAVKVARALHRAHSVGVIHRDIKPANILLAGGEPLVADFGIALAVSAAGGGRMTETGLSLGTPHYMSPEQAAADREPDPRSDLYSLGCVLFEMLAGEPPHTGSSAQAILARILTETPRPIAEIRRSVPPGVAAALQRSLQKLPADRFTSAEDFARALEQGALLEAQPGGSPMRQAHSRAPRPRRAVVAGAALAVVATTLLAVVIADAASPKDPSLTLRATLDLPGGNELHPNGIAITEDGSRVLVLADAGRTLLERDLSRFEFATVAETDRIILYPAYSPDGRWITVNRRPGLERIPVRGGPGVTLDPNARWDGGQWGADGALYYSMDYQSGIWRLEPGGEPEMLTRPDTARGELAHFWPQLLPDDEHLLYTVYRTSIDSTSVEVVSLRTGERRTILEGGVAARYLPTGHLVYARREVLMAAGFDVRRLAVTTPAAAVLDDLFMAHGDGWGAYAISATGTLVYLSASAVNFPTELVWVDRAGREEEIAAPPGRYTQPDLSPDGSSLALTITEPGSAPDVAVLDLSRGTLARLTRDGGTERGPVWHPNGTDIAYVAEQRIFDLHWRRADASRPAEPLVTGGFDKAAYAFTPDGSSLLYQVSVPGAAGAELWILPLGSREPSRIEVEGSNLRHATVSPDRRWLAYSSEESGRREVYMVSYPDVDRRKVRISAEGGEQPLWTRNGREIVYTNGTAVLAVAVDPEAGGVGRAQALFEGPYELGRIRERSYDVTPDGERFVLVKLPEGSSPRHVRIVTNFFDELRRLVPL